jgi:DNA-directed RNA polymerase specialized sigma24 family protein
MRYPGEKQEQPIIKSDGESVFKEARKGNVLAVASWIEHRKDRLYRIACVYREGRVEEDIFKKAIISIFKNIKELKDGKHFEYWAVSKLLAECKKTSGRRRRADALHDETACDKTAYVLDRLVNLKSSGKDIIALKYFGGYSLDEAALILGISLDDARDKMYQTLSEMDSMAGEGAWNVKR